MGKKKVGKKTKELSVAIAESSSIGTEPQQQTPRKRGRPRKIVEKTESEEIKEEQVQEEERETKKARGGEEDREGGKEGETSSSVKEEGKSGETGELPKPRSRARRKSKPRKSS